MYIVHIIRYYPYNIIIKKKMYIFKYFNVLRQQVMQKEQNFVMNPNYNFYYKLYNIQLFIYFHKIIKY